MPSREALTIAVAERERKVERAGGMFEYGKPSRGQYDHEDHTAPLQTRKGGEKLDERYPREREKRREGVPQCM